MHLVRSIFGRKWLGSTDGEAKSDRFFGDYSESGQRRLRNVGQGNDYARQAGGICGSDGNAAIQLNLRDGAELNRDSVRTNHGDI